MAFTNHPHTKPWGLSSPVVPFLLLSCLLSWHSPIDSTTSTDTIPTSTYHKADFPPNSIKEFMNEIEGCWRMNPNWASNRRALAYCAIRFGKAALGGKYGEIYTVTDPSDDPINPKPGTLRYGAIQTKPLWIVFYKDMHITLENELMVYRSSAPLAQISSPSSNGAIPSPPSTSPIGIAGRTTRRQNTVTLESLTP